MNNSNLPSIIQCEEIVNYFTVKNSLIFISLINENICIYYFFNLKLYRKIDNIFQGYTKDSGNPYKLNVIYMHFYDNYLFIQTRGGILIVLNIEFDLTSSKFPKITNISTISKIDTKIETFTPFNFSFLFNSEYNSLSIICPTEKKNNLKIYSFKDKIISETNSFEKNLDVIIDEYPQQIVDVYKQMDCKIFSLKDIDKTKEILVTYETTLFLIITPKYEPIAYYSFYNELKLYESLIISELMNIKDDIYIFVGLFSTKLVILKYCYQNKKIIMNKLIEDICPDIKKGISCFEFGVNICEEIFEDYEDNQENIKEIVFVGMYSRRVKFFELTNENNEIVFKDAGNLIVEKSTSINQIKYIDGYLLVSSNNKILSIYKI